MQKKSNKPLKDETYSIHYNSYDDIKPGYHPVKYGYYYVWEPKTRKRYKYKDVTITIPVKNPKIDTSRFCRTVFFGGKYEWINKLVWKYEVSVDNCKDSLEYFFCIDRPVAYLLRIIAILLIFKYGYSQGILVSDIWTSNNSLIHIILWWNTLEPYTMNLPNNYELDIQLYNLII